MVVWHFLFFTIIFFLSWNFRFRRFKTLVISYVVLISLVYKFLLLWNYIFCAISCFVTYHIMRLFILCDISTFVKCHTLWHLIILNIICCDSSLFLWSLWVFFYIQYFLTFPLLWSLIWFTFKMSDISYFEIFCLWYQIFCDISSSVISILLWNT